MELFSEVYGSYFTVVARILEQAGNGLSQSEIEELVNSEGFYDSAFHLLPSLFNGEWNLLFKKDIKYYSMLSYHNTKRPLTSLEKSWLKALLSDVRIRLFIDDKELYKLQQSLIDIKPLFLESNFHNYDKHLDGDDFSDENYIKNFKTILSACKNNQPVIIDYKNELNKQTNRQYLPYMLNYSPRDNKFRLLCAVYNKSKNKLNKIILNLARIEKAELSERKTNTAEALRKIWNDRSLKRSVLIEISKERNAIERCMLQFASFERQTEYDRERDIYTCRLWFDYSDETEILIRILSFGPTVKVIGPEHFVNQIKERIKNQNNLNKNV